MTPRQPFSEHLSVFSEDGANFGGQFVREMRDFICECRLSSPEAILFSPMTGYELHKTYRYHMEIGETLYVTDRDGFRKWLIENHNVKKEIWLIQYKKARKKPFLSYVDAVEEAICFGWIDGLEKSMDMERYAIRFSPRRSNSNWTNTNKDRARRMIAEGRMTPAGRAKLPLDVN